ncbi:MAG TPA: DNA polymerase III subunit gamma/tau [Candidatus Acidoferrum sp.]|nr:DNA polymerase III subunit gamma/tau [Candidatus Acidoferrum sp.]
MSYQVIARKWRPQTFKDLVGQEHVTGTLANAIRNDRVAHAYIFSGARGVGKTTAARILAKGLNCVKGPTAEPCGVCDSCREIAAGTSLDVIEIDAASNRGIDQIRELREMVRYAPAAARSKVVILDEAHMLTGEASNALLKTLEEPPDRVIFVMATTEPENLEDTIRSRSQHFHFRALTFNEIAERIKYIAREEGLKVADGAVAVIARMAEGSMRDSLSLLEQARAYCGDNIPDKEVRELLGVVPEDALNELVQAIATGSADRALGLVHTFQKEGRNLQHFCREAIRHIRNLLITRVCGADSDLIAATQDQRPGLEKAAAQFSEEDLTRFFNILLQTDDDLRRKPDPRVHLEMGMLRLIHAGRLAPLEELLAELGGDQAPAARSAASQRASAPSAAPAWSPRDEIASAAAVGFSPSPAAPLSASRPAPLAPPASSAPAWRSGQAAAVLAASRLGEAALAPVATPSATAPPAGDGIAEQAPPELEDRKGDGSLPASAFDRRSEEEPHANGKANGSPQSVAAAGISTQQMQEIRGAIQAQQKFLGELLEHGHRWELEGAELRIFFATDKRPFAEMVEARDSLEKIRTVASRVLNRSVRVCAKIEAVAATDKPASRMSDPQELRAKFERDPVVRSMLQRFGGKISEVKRREEGL